MSAAPAPEGIKPVKSSLTAMGFNRLFRSCALFIGASTLMLLTTPAYSSTAPRTYLASIQGVKLRPDEYVTGFSVDTWRVTFRAVCHIPPGWHVSAGRSAAPEGSFEGKGTHGISFLNRARLKELDGLTLITLSGPVQPRKIETAENLTPPTFDGKLTIGSYASLDRIRHIRLGSANIHLVPALRCPAAR